MSKQDFGAYGHIARRFVGQPMRLTVVTNSLKLVPEAGTYRTHYVWIDPPWSLWQNDEEVVNAGDYPEPDGPDEFKAFCARFACLRGSTLEDVRFVGDETTAFIFESGVLLEVWHQEPEPDEDVWYDDWYAKAIGPWQRMDEE